MSGKRVLVVLLIGWAELGAAASTVLGDGGTMRFSGRRGDRVVTVFTAPAPLHAGRIDLSVLVLGVETGRPITDLSIEVCRQEVDHPKRTIRAVATTEEATNKLLRAAKIELPEAGRWRFEVFVEGVDRSQAIGFDVVVAAPPPAWLQMSLWIGWPIVPIGLFAVVQRRLKRLEA